MCAKKVTKYSCCFVPGCRTRYSSDIKAKKLAGETYPSIFKGPNDPILLKKWHEAIGRKDKIFCPSNVVCSLHFLTEDILTFYETKMPDGSINRIKRGRPKLKEGVVPSIFPNLPYSSTSKKRRQPPCVETEFIKVKKYKINLQESLPDLEGNFVQIKNEDETATVFFDSEEKKYDPLFQYLKDSLQTISTPNGSWSGTFLPQRNEIIFAEWDETYSTKKKIIISCDMSYKVLFGTAEVSLDNDAIISSFVDLEDVIKIADKIEVCEEMTIR